MEKKVEILAYHGWGLDASFWDNFKSTFPAPINFKTANRGYFGKPFHPRFDSDTKFRVVFTHSFGLHWCNSAVLSKADLLVIFNGFGAFHPKKEKLKQLSEIGLASMIDNFDTKPREILRSFYKNCFYPSQKYPDIVFELNLKTLKNDLLQLKNTRFPLIDLDFGSTMIALDGSKDKVLIQPRGEEITASHYHKKFVKIFENSGHALPFTNPKECWSYLCSIIPIFEQYENNR